MRSKWNVSWVPAVVAAVLLAAPLLAQEVSTGTLEGKVTDDPQTNPEAR
jgi:hypothetical protein